MTEKNFWIRTLFAAGFNTDIHPDRFLNKFNKKNYTISLLWAGDNDFTHEIALFKDNEWHMPRECGFHEFLTDKEYLAELEDGSLPETDVKIINFKELQAVIDYINKKIEGAL